MYFLFLFSQCTETIAAEMHSGHFFSLNGEPLSLMCESTKGSISHGGCSMIPED